jgi:hypothetical protein
MANRLSNRGRGCPVTYINTGKFHCPQCDRQNTAKHHHRRICLDCFRAEKRAYQLDWNDRRRSARIAAETEAKRNAWCAPLASQFLSMPLRAAQ